MREVPAEAWGVHEMMDPQGQRPRAHYFGNALARGCHMVQSLLDEGPEKCSMKA